VPSLSSEHRFELETGSAIAPDIIAEREYQTITNPRALPVVFTGAQRKHSGLLFPIRDVTGDIATHQLKLDNPPDDANGRPIKYMTAAAGRSSIDVPTRVLPHLRNADVDLWVTEGCKKVDSALSHGIPCIVGILGVENWQSNGMALPDWKEIALRDRRVIIAYDSDVMTKSSVRNALERFAAWLKLQRADVRFLLMPEPGTEGTRR
jgi:hypothetical protein